MAERRFGPVEPFILYLGQAADFANSLQGQPDPALDTKLLEDFEREIWRKVPHVEGEKVTNASPLVDLTSVLRDCARDEFGLDFSRTDLAVFGKMDASLLGGSLKTRPAVEILHDAIASGKLRRGQVVFEATSGNFGIALGELTKLGIEVVVLVSRKLQEGVLDELQRSGVKIVNLDVDICPAPGLKVDPNTLVAKAVASNVRDAHHEARPQVKCKVLPGGKPASPYPRECCLWLERDFAAP